jgi:hypothetical protein
MALTSDSGLVPGAAHAASGPMRRVRLVRATCIDGQRREPGAEVDVPRMLAAELCSAGKAERVQPAAEPANRAKAPAAPSTPPSTTKG